nr:MAG TPA: hypothetical protein [Caudoviricetes sp.]
MTLSEERVLCRIWYSCLLGFKPGGLFCMPEITFLKETCFL